MSETSRSAEQYATPAYSIAEAIAFAREENPLLAGIELARATAVHAEAMTAEDLRYEYEDLLQRPDVWNYRFPSDKDNVVKMDVLYNFVRQGANTEQRSSSDEKSKRGKLAQHILLSTHLYLAGLIAHRLAVQNELLPHHYERLVDGAINGLISTVDKTDKTDAGYIAATITVATQNAMKDVRRKRSHKQEIKPPELEDPMPFDDVTEDINLTSLPTKVVVHRALEKLIPEHRRVLVLLFGIGGGPRLTAAMVAAHEGVPTGTIKSRYHYGRLALRKALLGMGITAEDI